MFCKHRTWRNILPENRLIPESIRYSTIIARNNTYLSFQVFLPFGPPAVLRLEVAEAAFLYRALVPYPSRSKHLVDIPGTEQPYVVASPGSDVARDVQVFQGLGLTRLADLRIKNMAPSFLKDHSSNSNIPKENWQSEMHMQMI